MGAHFLWIQLYGTCINYKIQEFHWESLSIKITFPERTCSQSTRQTQSLRCEIIEWFPN